MITLHVTIEFDDQDIEVEDLVKKYEDLSKEIKAEFNVQDMEIETIVIGES